MPEQLEERVAYLEAEVARLKNKIENGASSRPWWEQIAGTFADNSDYEEAMRLGREYRDSLRPAENCIGCTGEQSSSADAKQF